VSDLLPELFGWFGDVSALIRLGGLVGIAIVVFVETGLPFGFFLPGDSLLITAGVFAARGDLDPAGLIAGTSLAAVLGDAAGYAIGRRAGAGLSGKRQSRWLNAERLEAAHAFYERHGGKTIVLARFVPLLRTFAPIVAGIAEMPYRRFALWNLVGGILWVASMCGTGFLLGRFVPGLIRHLPWLVSGVIFVSLLPLLVGWWRERRIGAQRDRVRPGDRARADGAQGGPGALSSAPRPRT